MLFDLCEMKDIVDVLYLIGVYLCQQQTLRSLWSPRPSRRAIFFASFGRNRFEQLLTNLGFDSGEGCNTDDKPAPFRKMWKQFFENFRKHYAVSSYVIKYEQPRSFLGR